MAELNFLSREDGEKWPRPDLEPQRLDLGDGFQNARFGPWDGLVNLSSPLLDQVRGAQDQRPLRFLSLYGSATSSLLSTFRLQGQV